MHAERLLLIDDEPSVLHALHRMLRLARPAWKVSAFNDAETALARASGHAFSLALVDFRMPGMDGAQALKRLRVMQPDCVRVILSGQTDRQGLVDAINEARIARFLSKPWDESALLTTLDDLLADRRRRLAEREQAESWQSQHGQLSPQALELQRLERLEPGITQVRWGPMGEVLMDEPAEDLR